MFVQMNPIYGRNYKKGQAYFTYKIDSPISKGISWFTCKEESDELKKVSHCGIVITKDLGIASLNHGFIYQSLDDIFIDPQTRIFFKEPILLDKDGPDNIIRHCMNHEGTPYNWGLAIGFAFINLYLMRKYLSLEKRKRILAKFDEKDKLICSQAVMLIMYLASMHDDFNFIKSPYEVLMHKMFKEWK